MAQEHETTYEAPSSGLLLGVEALPGAVDRGKANGAVADNDGND
ncbi:hypothetical protein [Saccharothrix coeruleofusca]|uniref:Uncharacterized protein n=1 Tax=Saccharothrix coeruleofusca TaxID=33919 RepID=A0A918EFQ1_9PSEU|nr:hypothetical protein [Saccharothrix coeruleofusca]MBP2337862.1 hypothetical protein [Saccharothrix coeruleofusca]GGP62769.1 hypothetical protein GCM10010185_39080 [Saccharothrix coeruleofusca]